MAAIRFQTVTLTGAAQQLVTTHIPIEELHIENDSGNATVKVGNSDLSATVYGASIPAATEKVFAQGPNGICAFPLSDVYVLGTLNQKVRLTFIVL